MADDTPTTARASARGSMVPEAPATRRGALAALSAFATLGTAAPALAAAPGALPALGVAPVTLSARKLLISIC